MTTYEKCNFQLYGHTGWVYSFETIHNDVLCSGSSDHSIRTWDIEETICDKVLLGHEGLVSCLIYNDAKGVLLSGSHDHQIHFWDTRLKNSSLQHFNAHNSQINDIDLIDENNFITVSDDMSVKVFDFRKLPSESQVSRSNVTPVRSFTSSYGNVHTVKYNQGDIIIGCARALYSINSSTGELKQIYEGHYSDVLSIGISGSELYSASKDRTIRKYDIKEGTPLGVFDKVHSHEVTKLQIYDDVLYSSSLDSTIQEMSLETNQISRTFERIALQIYTLHRNKDLLYCGCDEHVIRAWKV